MSEQPDVDTPPAPPGIPAADMPDTDDPAILRELLRQAREHLRLRESIERLMADNIARTEALLFAARATRDGAGADAASMREEIAAARSSLSAALAALERLDNLAEGTPAPAADSSPVVPAPLEPVVTSSGTIEVLIHDVRSPALARSLQQHLGDLPGVRRAEVRELAEGLLRITVESATPIDGDALAAWEPQRARTVRTARTDVLEIELIPDA